MGGEFLLLGALGVSRLEDVWQAGFLRADTALLCRSTAQAPPNYQLRSVL